jgi:hypothetical protein
LVVGHSHTLAVIAALRSAEPGRRHGHVLLRRSPARSPAVRLVRAARKQVAKALSRGQDAGLPLIVGAAAAEIRHQVAAGLANMLEPRRRVRVRQIPTVLRESGITVLASIGGNGHNVFGLVEFEVPFDFVLPSHEDLGADPTKQLVPYDAVRQILEERVQRALREIALLRDIAGERMLVLESPPPIGDDAQILKCSRPYFFKHGDSEWRVVSPALRYKLWRVSSEIYSDFCRERGLVFVSAPTSAMDAGMFLKREGWLQHNPLHGNAWYGERVVDSLRALLTSEADGVTRLAAAGP